MRRAGRFAALIATFITFGCVSSRPIPSSQPIPTVSCPSPVVVKGSFTTSASNGPGEGINIDVVGGTALPTGKVKRYTVTIQTALLSTAPAGVDGVEVTVGVLKGSESFSVRVLRQDPATASPFPHPGFTIPPYVGTGSYIRVLRGADGLGPVQVSFNAYVEVEP